MDDYPRYPDLKDKVALIMGIGQTAGSISESDSWGNGVAIALRLSLNKTLIFGCDHGPLKRDTFDVWRRTLIVSKGCPAATHISDKMARCLWFPEEYSLLTLGTPLKASARNPRAPLVLSLLAIFTGYGQLQRGPLNSEPRCRFGAQTKEAKIGSST